MLKKNIKRIVLTGGPCAGKTTIFNAIYEYLTKKDYYVITIKETATELIKSGIYTNSNREHTLMFQDIVLKQQYIKEHVADTFAKKIAKDKNVVILYDRAIIDNWAYLDSQDDFEKILANNNLDEFKVLNSYDLVIDLISTATLKPDSYELDGVRYETVEEATILDKKTSTAWVHHPNLRVIKPTSDIEDKKNIVIKEIDKYLKNIKQNNKQLYHLDISSDLSIYNNSNSKIVSILKLYLNNNLVINEKKYRNSTIYTLSDNCNEKVISKEEVINIIYKNKIIADEQYKEINFIDIGNLYKIIEKNGEIYLECDRLLLIPNNLILKSKKEYMKTRKYDII